MHVCASRSRLTAALAAVIGVLALAGCGSSSSSSSSAAGGSSSSTSAAGASSSGTPTSASGGSAVSLSSCGTKPGVAATGSPINIGTIDTHQPGTDFTDGPNMITVYFDCVNANGGVNGHPLKL